MIATIDLIACHSEMTRDCITAARAFTADRGNAHAKARFDHMRETLNELAQTLWQHQPAAVSDQIVWAEYMLNGATFFLICRDNIAMFRNARNRAEAILGH
jgi:FPC/CPF motif-containing protein YcgG